MVEEPVSGQELKALHERITWTVGALRGRFRRRLMLGPRVPDEVFRLAEEAVYHLKVTPRLAVGVGAALAAVAVAAVVLAARNRRS